MIEWSEYVDVWLKVKRSARTTISKDGEALIRRTLGKRGSSSPSIVLLDGSVSPGNGEILSPGSPSIS